MCSATFKVVSSGETNPKTSVWAPSVVRSLLAWITTVIRRNIRVIYPLALSRTSSYMRASTDNVEVWMLKYYLRTTIQASNGQEEKLRYFVVCHWQVLLLSCASLNMTFLSQTTMFACWWITTVPWPARWHQSWVVSPYSIYEPQLLVPFSPSNCASVHLIT